MIQLYRSSRGPDHYLIVFARQGLEILFPSVYMRTIYIKSSVILKRV